LDEFGELVGFEVEFAQDVLDGDGLVEEECEDVVEVWLGLRWGLRWGWRWGLRLGGRCGGRRSCRGVGGHARKI